MKKKYLPLLFLLICSTIVLLSFVIDSQSSNYENDKTTFDKFINSFPEATLPYAISEDVFFKNEKEGNGSISEIENIIPYGFAQFVPKLMSAQFTRRAPNMYKFEAKLFENEAFAVVVYSVIPSFKDLKNQPIEYLLATYNKTDKEIDPFKRQIMEFSLAKHNRFIKIGEVQPDLKITVETFRKRVTGGIKNKAFETKTYQINKKGLIVEINPDLKVEEKVQKEEKGEINF